MKTINTPEEAIAYLTDCQLATVEGLAMKKNKSKYEFERQIKIAQTGIDFMSDFGSVVTENDRAYKARNAGGVAEWAKKFER